MSKVLKMWTNLNCWPITQKSNIWWRSQYYTSPNCTFNNGHATFDILWWLFR